MSFRKVIRATEWWEYKLPPILAMAYATGSFSDVSLYHLAPFFLFYLASIVIGAIYVSIINDITDIEIDLAVGKRNRMTGIPEKWRWFFPALCVVLGTIFGYFMWPDVLTIVLYSMAWIAFSLYSIPPFRLKNRAFLGVLCDASGAHLFPTLTMLSGISYVSYQTFDPFWFSIVGLWAFSFGLRGILWHQYLDRENDIKTGTNTFGSRAKPTTFKWIEWICFAIETLSFSAILFLLDYTLLYVFLVMYMLLLFIRSKRYAHQLIILRAPIDKPFQVVMLDFYHVFFPVGILLVSSFSHPSNLVVLGFHLLLFPYKTWVVFKDYVKAILRR